ncbi:nuclear pore complex protein Nup37 [Dermatophagoides farinae]|uniref:Nucleoporin Nup37 n=1 Tax=Dermatophagoides farinae TaxID=6954 RepID=A0A922HSE0_DERFA|nr:nucleoporin Nup37-like [Dermatophagoides farinae]KAH7643543.1 hypothetical protein HUG17_5905 [Dermatophagoides farinae]KAH9506386.1 Nucleoporin Nup37 [Dermatophagoides farinae]
MIGQKLTNFSPFPNVVSSSMNNNKIQNFYEEFHIDLKQATEKTINSVQFCPFDGATDILACCVRERIFIYRISLIQTISGNDDKSGDGTEFDYQFIYNYICGSKCSSLVFGPKTDFSQQAQHGFLSLAIATEDFGILLLNQTIQYDDDSQNNDAEQQFFAGHINHINDMAFEPISGEQLASTGDDCLCIIRSLRNEQSMDGKNVAAKIMLSSPGVSVKWHRTEPNKLLVAEKKGMIRFYDTITHVAVMSFDCNCYPLTSSDWCSENNLFIGCASDRNLFFWDTSLTSLPIKILKTDFEGLSEFSFYDSKLIAYRARPYSFLTVKNFITNQTFIERNLIAGRGISWNRSMPLLAVGGPKYVHLFKFNVF